MKSFPEIVESLLFEINREGHPVEGSSDVYSVSTSFGKSKRPYKELLAYQFSLDPTDSVISFSPITGLLPDPGHLIAMFLWMLRGSKDVSEIAYYNENAVLFANERGEYDCPLGYRLGVVYPTLGLWRPIEILSRNPNSRRAFIPLIHPDDQRKLPRDYPCPAFFHFLLRNGKLHLICCMRSQSIHLLAADVSLAILFQGLVASRLQREIGVLHYIMNSVHLYNDHADRFRIGTPIRYTPWPYECVTGKWIGTDELLAECERFEQAVRTRTVRDILNAITSVSPLLRQPLAMLALTSLNKAGQRAAAQRLAMEIDWPLGDLLREHLIAGQGKARRPHYDEVL